MRCSEKQSERGIIMVVKIYIESDKLNGQKRLAGYGAILNFDGKETSLGKAEYGRDPLYMTLRGVIDSLTAVKGKSPTAQIELYTTNGEVKKAIADKEIYAWKKRRWSGIKLAEATLWEEILMLTDAMNPRVYRIKRYKKEKYFVKGMSLSRRYNGSYLTFADYCDVNHELNTAKNLAKLQCERTKVAESPPTKENPKSKEKVRIYTQGIHGAWGVIVETEGRDVSKLCGTETRDDCAMSFKAVLEGLKAAEWATEAPVEVYVTNPYAVGVLKNLKDKGRADAAYADLVQEIRSRAENLHVTFYRVRKCRNERQHYQAASYFAEDNGKVIAVKEYSHINEKIALACRMAEDGETENLKTDPKIPETKEIIKIFVNGKCGGKGKKFGVGSWGAVICVGKEEHTFFGKTGKNTISRIELKAVIEAISRLKNFPRGKVEVYSDSEYVVNAFQKKWINGWKRRGWKRSGGDLQNKDLWQVLDALVDGLDITFLLAGDNVEPSDFDASYKTFQQKNNRKVSMDEYRRIVDKSNLAGKLATKKSSL